VSVAGDSLIPTNLYAITKEVDEEANVISSLVIFEIKQSQNRVAAEECKIFGKIRLDSNKNDTDYSLDGLRGFTVIMDDQGVVKVFKSTEMNELIQDPTLYLYNPFEKLERSNSSVPLVKNTNVRELKSLQGSYVMMRNPLNLKQLILSEFIKMDDKQEEDWSGSSTFKFGMIVSYNFNSLGHCYYNSCFVEILLVSRSEHKINFK